MIPKSKAPKIIRTQSSSKTWIVKNGRLVKKVDGLEAVMAAVEKLFATERYTQPVYSGNYGVELESLIGKSRPFVVAVMEQRLTEALLQDDRIREVTITQIRAGELPDVLLVDIDIFTVEGRLKKTLAVNI